MNTESKYSPFFSILDVVDKNGDTCIYSMDINIGVNDGMLNLNGLMYFKSNSYYVNYSLEESFEYVRTFDFKTQEGDTYSFNFTSFENKYIVHVEKLRVFNTKEGDEIHVFKLIDSFNYFGHRLDMVLLLSPLKGFLGSYVVDEITTPPVITIKAGNLFEEYIDYSKYKFRDLK